MLAQDPLVQGLLKRFPALTTRVKRLSEHDRQYLCDLSNEVPGVTHREALHVGRLVRDNRHAPGS